MLKGGAAAEQEQDSTTQPPVIRRKVKVTRPQGCVRREGTSEVAPEAVRQAVGGGCQSG